jgi:hypothetical protein
MRPETIGMKSERGNLTIEKAIRFAEIASPPSAVSRAKPRSPWAGKILFLFVIQYL